MSIAGVSINRCLTDKAAHHHAVLHHLLHGPLQLTIFLQAHSLLIVGSVVLRIPHR
jgi:hypothetical protein